MNRLRLIMAVLLALVLIMPFAVAVQAADIGLTITGDGVDSEMTFTLSELEAMAASRNAYSALNTWPTKSTYYAEGVPLAALLEKAGLSGEATTINVSGAPAADGSPGYNMTFLLDDLLAERYTYEGAQEAVPAIIAIKLSDKGFSNMDDADLRLVYGQLDEQEQTSAGFVKSARTITVTCAPVRQHPGPEAAAERLADGQYSVSLKSGNVNAKIYYTTDGATPTVHSSMYNISAPHWQPQLNVPFIVGGDTVVKAIAVATGYANSEELIFTPASLAGEATSAEPSMANFNKTGSYITGQYTDVDEGLWYGAVVATVYEYGLMRGTEANIFNPTGDITLAEAITLAARVHSIYSTGNEHTAQGDIEPWYKSNVDYAIADGIIKPDDFPDYTRKATRAEMIYIFSRALPNSEFKEENSVNSLPDVGSGTPYHDSIFMLYRAGVLTGNDALGTFCPGDSISRAETAAIISRIVLPDTRYSGKTY